MSRILKSAFLSVSALFVLGTAACERHSFEDTKVFSQGHGHHGDAHADDAPHGTEDAAHPESQERDVKEPRKFISAGE